MEDVLNRGFLLVVLVPDGGEVDPSLDRIVNYSRGDEDVKLTVIVVYVDRPDNSTPVTFQWCRVKIARWTIGGRVV